MRRICERMFTWFSLFVMVFGFFFPNASYIVNAFEIDETIDAKVNDEVKTSDDVFTNVVDGVITIDMTKDEFVEIKPKFHGLQLWNCSAGGSIINVVSTMGYSCKIYPKEYGRTVLNVAYMNENQEIFNVKYIVDIQLEEYFNDVVDKVPTTYEYNHVEYLTDYLSKTLPSDVKYSFDYQCMYSANSVCSVTFSKDYQTIDGTERVDTKITKTKEITIVDDVVDIGYPFDLAEQYLDVGEVKKLQISLDGNITDYFWVSSNNNVAKVNEANELIGVGPGNAELRIINKNTNEYKNMYVYVNSSYKKRPMEDILNIFTGTVNIDASNGAGYYDKQNLKNSALIYFNKLAKSLNDNELYGLYGYDITCAENLKDCVITYSYYSNSGTVTGQTQYFDIEFTGINVTVLRGDWFNRLPNTLKYHIPKGGQFYFSDEDIENFDSDIMFDYDEEYFSYRYTDTGLHVFTALKEGRSKISLYSTDGSMSEFDFEILFTTDSVNHYKNYFENLNKITLPLKVDFANLGLLEQTIEAYVKKDLQNNSVAKYIDITVKEVLNNDVRIKVSVKYNGYDLTYFTVFEKLIDVEYGIIGDQILVDNVKEFVDGIKDEYILDQGLSFKLASSYSITEDFYANLINHVDLKSDLEHPLLTTEVIFGGTFKYSDNLIGGAYYDIYIYCSGYLVGYTRTFVRTNFIINRKANDTNEDNITYIKKYIMDKSELDVNVVSAFDNYYKVSYNDKSFYVLLDQKAKVPAQNVTLYLESENIIVLDVGEMNTIEYEFSPFDATYADLQFVSSNTNIFTVNDDGVVNGVSKGIANMTVYLNGMQTYTITVVVGYDKDTFVDSIVKDASKDVLINYSSLTYSSLEESIGWALSSKVSQLYNGLYYLEVDVKIVNNQAYAVYYFGNYSSSEYKVSYRMVGIKLDDLQMELDVGQTKKIKVFFSEGDNTNLRYRSLNEEVASVDSNGNITGLKPGKTFISIFDKYHDYWNEIEVFVSIDKYKKNLYDTITSTTFVVNGDDVDTTAEFGTGVSIALSHVMQEQGYNLWDIYETSSMSYEYRPDEGKVYYTLYTLDGEKEIAVNVKLEGIFLLNGIVDLYLNDSYGQEFQMYGGYYEVNGVSKNPDICTVEGRMVYTHDKTGVCEIEYSADNYKLTQYIIVNRDGFKDLLNEKLEVLDDEVDLKVDEVDVSRLDDYTYLYYYDKAFEQYIFSKFEDKDYSDIWYGVPWGSEGGDIGQVSLNYNYTFKTSKYNSYSENLAASDKKNIKINFVGHTLGWEDEGKRILANIKDEYILSIDQMMDFLLDDADSYDLDYYSDLPSDIAEMCNNCTYTRGEGGAFDDGSGYVESGFLMVLLKDGEPIGMKNLTFISNIFIDVPEIESDEHIHGIVKEKIQDAYKKHKHRHEGITFSRLRSDVSLIDDEEEYEVELEVISTKGNSIKYDVTIDGVQFTTDVYLNITTKDADKVYSKSNLGDIDLDGEISITDLVRLRKYLAGSENLNNEQVSNADIDKDGEITITDLVKLRKYLAGSEEL